MLIIEGNTLHQENSFIFDCFKGQSKERKDSSVGMVLRFNVFLAGENTFQGDLTFQLHLKFSQGIYLA